MQHTIVNGNNLVWLKEQPDNSIDHIVTDPPYLLRFMGNDWDKAEDNIAGSKEFWEECLRVVKPGGYCLSFGHSRTHHRVMTAIEDAGWEIRDCLQWLQGQGFPKSQNIGNKLGQEWQGWGTALKPAYEPIIMARKPFKGSLINNITKWGTGALNIDACRIGTSGGETHKGGFQKAYVGSTVDYEKGGVETDLTPKGRFPANVILSHNEGCKLVGTQEEKVGTRCNNRNELGQCMGHGDHNNAYGVTTHGPDNEKITITEVYECEEGCPVKLLDDQSGITKSNKRKPKHSKDSPESSFANTSYCPPHIIYGDHNTYDDAGGASRFFYCAKVSTKERNLGCNDLFHQNGQKGNGLGRVCATCGVPQLQAQLCSCENKSWVLPAKKGNNHPTVKPVALMKWLVKLVSREGQTVLDPFMGSGSTALACVELDRNFIGLELDPNYCDIAQKRIEAWKKK